MQSPAHASAFDPATQGGQVVVGQAEAAAHGGNVDEIEQFADRETRLVEPKQMLQRHDQRHVAARLAIGHGEGNEPRIVKVDATENRFYVGRVDTDVRDHHDHIARLQRFATRRSRGKTRKQRIVQDLHFAQRTMRHVEHDRIVIGAQHRLWPGEGNGSRLKIACCTDASR